MTDTVTVPSFYLCDYWLPDRTKCPEPAVVEVEIDNAPLRFCRTHEEGGPAQYGKAYGKAFPKVQVRKRDVQRCPLCAAFWYRGDAMRRVRELLPVPEGLTLSVAHGELLRAADRCLEAARIVADAPRSRESVRRVLERYGRDPEADEYFQRMVQNPAREYFGWDKAPSTWPWGAGTWQPSPDVRQNLALAGALIAAELDRLSEVTA